MSPAPGPPAAAESLPDPSLPDLSPPDLSLPDLSPPDLSVVVPVYFAEATLDALLERLTPVLEASAGRWEVLLVDDGSRDGSWAAIERLAAGNEARGAVRGLRLSRNYGQHNALLAGIREARHPLVVTLDDDLQNPPEEIPRLLAALTPEVDVVYGTPRRGGHGLWRNLASSITKLALQSAMGADIARDVSAFRLFRRDLRRAFADFQGPFVSLDILLTWGTQRFAAVPVELAPRTIGTSHYTFGRLVTHALNMMTGFSVLPLQAASLTGLAFAVFGMGVLAYVLGNFLVRGQAVPGFAFLASIIALFSGAQLLALGIIGEYLARMHFRTMAKPAYAVRERTAPEPSP